MTMKNLMLVDDQESLLRLLRLLFEQRGFKVVTATSAREALNFLALAKLTGSLPDLIVTDGIMPGIDGIEFIKQLKLDPALSGIPVIMFTNESASFLEVARTKGAEMTFSKSAWDPLIAYVSRRLV